MRGWRLPWVLPTLVIAGAAVLAMTGVAALGLGLRAAFVLASAAPAGGVLLLAIARVTGAPWNSVGAPIRALPWIVGLGIIATLSALPASIPPHLSWWAHPMAVTVRVGLAFAGLAWGGSRLRAGAGVTFAALLLTLYAWLITPIAADLLLAAEPSHPVSAIGMMLFLVQFAAGCIAGILSGNGRERRDLMLLLVAALLGLCYLGFMDYLVIWFGNLPQRVPFYLDRPGWPAALVVVVAIGGGIAGAALNLPIFQAASGIGALVVAVLWWMGCGPVATLVALAGGLMSTLSWRGLERRHGRGRAHG